MARYTPPEQSKAMQWVDIIVVVAAIFLALWLPLQTGWAGNSKVLVPLQDTALEANPTWEALGQTPAQVEQWTKLGYDAKAAHDVIQNKWDYTINGLQLALLTVALVGYFVFLFRASDKEYRDVIDEKFNNK
jgi:hypothetical protein